MQNGPGLVQLMQKFLPRSRIGIFHNERTWSTPLDPKLMFWCVLYYLGAFSNVSLLHETRCKMGWTVQLMQKFVPWSHFGIFCNECTRPTPLDPKLMSCCVSQCLGAFWIVSLLHEAWCKTGWTGAINAKVFAMKSHQNFSQRTHLIHPIETLNSCFGASHSIWVHLAMFCYYTKLGAKRVELVQLMQKYVPWSRIRIFRNECTRSTPLGPKLMFWCVS